MGDRSFLRTPRHALTLIHGEVKRHRVARVWIKARKGTRRSYLSRQPGRIRHSRPHIALSSALRQHALRSHQRDTAAWHDWASRRDGCGILRGWIRLDAHELPQQGILKTLGPHECLNLHL